LGKAIDSQTEREKYKECEREEARKIDRKLIGLKYQTETFGQQSEIVESTQLWGNREVNYQPINICRPKGEEEDEAQLIGRLVIPLINKHKMEI